MKERVPTFTQARTLEWLIEGSQLIIGKWGDYCGPEYAGKERIYWRIKIPQLISPLNPEGFDTVDCGYPKLKRHQMSHLERYGWVTKTETGWEITDEGKKAKERYDAWIKTISNRMSNGGTIK